MNTIHLLVVVAVFALMGFAGCDDGGSASNDGGPDTDTDTDTDNDCAQGGYSGDVEITTQSDVATLAGYTSISGRLTIDCLSCTDLSELICLTSVGESLHIDNSVALTNLDGLNGIASVDEDLRIQGNIALTNLDGLSGITSLVGSFGIYSNSALPDCEVCDLLDQLTEPLPTSNVMDNLSDICTPVPTNCP